MRNRRSDGSFICLVVATRAQEFGSAEYLNQIGSMRFPTSSEPRSHSRFISHSLPITLLRGATRCYLYTHLRRKIGNAIVTRSEQPTRRWQLSSAPRLQLARGSSTVHSVAMGPHSLHTGRPPCWKFVLAPFAPRARKLGCAMVCNKFWLGLHNRLQFLELVFG